MNSVFICDGFRTPIGRYGGSLSSVRPDDLASIPIRSLQEAHQDIDWECVDDVVFGCANQAGEDNRNVARMAALLSGLPVSVPGNTINRLCGSGLDAVSIAARAIKCGEQNLVIAGGVESMSRAPFVMPKAESAYARANQIYDTTIGWRFPNRRMHSQYGTDSMPETAENVAEQFKISREDQDVFALWSQEKTQRAILSGRFDKEIVPVEVPQRKGDSVVVNLDEHPRATTLEKLSKLKPIVKNDGSITAGNASGVNDGACAMILASEQMMKRYNLNPLARIVGFATSGVEPRIMGMGPVSSTEKLLSREGIAMDEVDVIELNEAFAAQAVAVLRELGVEDNDPRVNPNGGAIALGHPLGMSGARLALTASLELSMRKANYAITTMCIGVGQGISMLIGKP
ncbi:MAG: 3-oxoadipyl-CoA thiolase [Betaproteobacteria bacterium]